MLPTRWDSTQGRLAALEGFARNHDLQRGQSTVTSERETLNRHNGTGGDGRHDDDNYEHQPTRATAPQDISDGLIQQWAPTFASIPIDKAAARAYVRKYKPSMDLSLARMPTCADSARYFSSCKATATGKDGLPCCVYRNRRMMDSLYQLFLYMEEGGTPYDGFCDVIMYFLIKGIEDDDHTNVARTPDQTRPIGLRNTDLKSILALVTMGQTTIFSRDANPCQNGGTKGRNFANNVVQLDTRGRILTQQCSDDLSKSWAFGIDELMDADDHDPHMSIPILIFHDFSNPYGSVARGYIYITHEEYGMADGARGKYQQCSSNVAAYIRVENQGSKYMCMIMAGAIQGCTSSGFVFGLAMDPFLNDLTSFAAPSGDRLYRACCDDVGAALSFIRFLIPASQAFERFEEFAGPKQKPKKASSCRLGLRTNLPRKGLGNSC